MGNGFQVKWWIHVDCCALFRVNSNCSEQRTISVAMLVRYVIFTFKRLAICCAYRLRVFTLHRAIFLVQAMAVPYSMCSWAGGLSHSLES